MKVSKGKELKNYENAIGSCQKKKTCDRIAMNSVQKRGEILWLISEKELYSTDGFREWDSAIRRNILPSHWADGWVRNEWDGTVTLEIQGREMLINKLLVGLNHNQFITIDWMDTKEIPVEQENSFWVK